MLFVIWAAFTSGQTGMTAVTLIVASVAIGSTAAGSGPFLRTSADESLLVLEVFLATLAMLGMILAGVLTEHHAATEALRQSEAHYRTLFESANDAILIIKDNVFSDCNVAAELGSPAARARNCSDILQPRSPRNTT